MMLRATIAVLGLVCASVAQAGAPPRCSLLSQVATNTFLQFAGALNAGDPSRIAQTATLLNDVTGSYAALACDVDALGRTLDCLIENRDNQSPRSAAQNCLAQEGLVDQN